MLEKIGSVEINYQECFNFYKLLEENGYKLVLVEESYFTKKFIISKEKD